MEKPFNNYNNIFFDLDGTLTNPFEGITNSVIHALKRMNITPPPQNQLACFIGPPLDEIFMEKYNLTQPQAHQAIEYFREYFQDKGILENVLYDGIPETLQALKQAGKRLFLATSKPEEFAKRVLDRFDLTKYFTGIYGADMHGERYKKDLVIKYALNNIGIVDTTDCVMVGDKEHDVIGAKKCGFNCIGVLYGYGSLQELLNAGAIEVVKTPQELLTLLK